MKVKQSIPKALRYTVRQFNAEFPNDDACLEFIKERRFPGGVTTCGKCRVERKHHRVTGRTAYACGYCGSQIYPLAGTIFEKSSTSLRLWFYAAFLMGSTRCGISAKQIQRETGVTYKTAWRMFKQIRMLMSDGDLELEGPTVEMDETYYGGVRKYGTGRPMRGDRKKTTVVALVERGGKVVARVVPNITGATMLGLVRKHVKPGSIIYTDELKSYQGISVMRAKNGKSANYWHRTIRHKSGIYAIGEVHTNTVEGFWSLFKRSINGAYHWVSKKYLQSYLDEFTFRYNRRHEGNQQFRSILKRVSERAA